MEGLAGRQYDLEIKERKVPEESKLSPQKTIEASEDPMAPVKEKA